MRQPKVLIAAGGTGGHIYPALAIAEALTEAHPEVTIEFVGTAAGLENQVLLPKGYRVHHLAIGRLNSNVARRERLKTLCTLPYALAQSARLLRREKPALVLGVGGHASGPLLLMASLLGYRSAIWEPNAMPGMANRWLARFVDECWAVFEEARVHLRNAKLHPAGMPIRREIEAGAARSLAAGASAAPAAAGAKFRVLIFGGSQGARGLNNTVVEMIKSGESWAGGFNFVHQTGAADYARVRGMYGALPDSLDIDLREYLHDMDAQYAAADLVICRSGTGTLSELAAVGKPSILVPLPTAADDHQRINAESFAEDGAALVIPQRELTAAGLRASIERLRADPARLERMGAAARARHVPRAAEQLAREFWARIETDASR